MMKKYKWNIAIILILIVGLSVMLYPSFSNYWNEKHQSRVVASYKENLSTIPEEDYEELWKKAEVYNEEIRKMDAPFRNYDLLEGYNEILDLSGTGIMGYISIDEIGVEYPIYHGTTDGVLQIAVGHMQGSSFPTGGAGNHVVLSAHNGLSDQELFTNLDQMKIGDQFSLVVLDRTLTYQVDQIVVVEPDDFSQIQTDAEHDYCTLITCTPFGVNSHRLLVRGVRVDGEEEFSYVTGDAQKISTDTVALVIFAVLSTITVLVYLLFLWQKKRKQHTEGTEK